MKWKNRSGSSNVRVSRGGKTGGLGIGGILIGLVLWLVFGMNPMSAFQAGQSVTGGGSGNASMTELTADDGRDAQFVSVVLKDTETIWNQIFQENGRTYQEPQLILFNGRVNSACGMASAATGPFYCPADQKVYLDTSFFADMRRELGVTGDQQGSGDAENRGKAGDFAQAYVIAHEVGHHVQYLLGISKQVRLAQKQARTEAQANEWSVRQELQADCFAGVWANRNQKLTNFLDPGDIEEAMHAASQIGDDRIAHNHGQVAMPDNFTHGTSQQRMRWFKKGLQTGDVNVCDTFSGAI